MMIAWQNVYLMGRSFFGGIPKDWSKSSMEDSSFGPINLERTNSIGEGIVYSVVPPFVLYIQKAG